MSVELAMKGDLPAATQRWIPTQPSPQGGWAYVSNFHTQEARVPRGGATRILAVRLGSSSPVFAKSDKINTVNSPSTAPLSGVF